ncbi:MAG: mechanosensitive ion channel family protein [Polyangiales bacterium]
MDDTTALFEFFRPEGIVPALIALSVAYACGRLLTKSFEQLGERFHDRRLFLHQLKSILRLVAFAIGAVVATSFVFAFSSEALIALGGTLAVAVGFAFKDLLASVIAGVIILVDRPFQVGDRVSFGGFYGEVIEIGLRTVRIVTLDDNLVTIPNNKFLTDPVSSGNAGELDMLVETDFVVGFDQDIALAKRIVGEAMTSSRYAYLEKPWAVVLAPEKNGSTFGVRLKGKVYVIDVKYEKALQTDITEQVMNAFLDAGIQPPAVLHLQASS